MLTTAPGAYLRTSAIRSSGSSTASSSTRVITSPAFRPSLLRRARPAATVCSFTPPAGLRKAGSGVAPSTGAAGLALLDDVLRLALGLVDRDREREADVAGVCWSDDSDLITELIPTARPARSNSGPPELPWFTAASVWIAA
jgi:hypothetical protein